MRRIFLASSLLLLSAPVSLMGQGPNFTSKSTGMEFVLIKPGSIVISRYQPRCPNVNTPPPADSAPQSAAASQVPAGGQNASVPAGNPGLAGPGAGGPSRVPRGPGQVVTQEMHDRCLQLAARDSLPGFTAKIEKPFYMAKYDVTQGEWKKVMGSNPSHFQGNKVSDDADRHPVDNVTWEMAQQFIAKLNKLEHTKAYRLPTEFEWEYAARAGGDDDIPWNQITKYGWYAQNMPGTGFGGRGPAPAPPAAAPGNPGSPAATSAPGAAVTTALPPKPTTHAVGQKEPNPWGLYDMMGNVWQWTQDYYNNKWLADPTPPKSGTTHVLKGASFNEDQIGASYFNHAGGPADGWDVGFRVVRDAE